MFLRVIIIPLNFENIMYAGIIATVMMKSTFKPKHEDCQLLTSFPSCQNWGIPQTTPTSYQGPFVECFWHANLHNIKPKNTQE